MGGQGRSVSLTVLGQAQLSGQLGLHCPMTWPGPLALQQWPGHQGQDLGLTDLPPSVSLPEDARPFMSMLVSPCAPRHSETWMEWGIFGHLVEHGLTDLLSNVWRGTLRHNDNGDNTNRRAADTQRLPHLLSPSDLIAC